MMVKVSEIRGRYSFEGRAYGPFQPSSERPFVEVPETLARALNLPLYGEKPVKAEVKAEAPAPKPAPVSSETATPLPDTFPMRSALVGAGFGTVEAVGAATDEQLEAVDGIGAKTVERIREALK